MATTEHCLFCFETLAAELSNRKPLGLEEVQASYAEYLAATASTSSGATAPKQLPALRRIAVETAPTTTTTTPSSSSSALSSVDSSATASTTSLSKASASSSSDNNSYASAATSATSLSNHGLLLPDSPLFVTWNSSEDEDDADEYALRGCIGTFDAQPLEQGLSTYALTAALGDTRFPPVARRELRHLEVAVTLLTDFEPATGGVEDWELGKHGLRISFTTGGRKYGATYLPDVAPEQGWTKEETLVSLMRKAGWTGRRDQWRKVDVRVVRYQGAKKSLAYAEFKAWRDWVSGQAAAAAAAAGSGK